MSLRCLALLCILIAPITARSAEFATLADARKTADTAVAFFVQEKVVAGYGVLKPYWPVPGVEVDNLANQTNTQWPMLKGRFGQSLRSEFVKECKAGESLARFVYLQKFQNHALRWVFTIYKPKDKWVFNSVSFDDNVGVLFQGSDC
ncbi:MAG: hypothetical protein REI94_03710 [Moraxellaceae bacterium]|nr:hypothetical protein [Moraxellaceae bacterium]